MKIEKPLVLGALLVAMAVTASAAQQAPEPAQPPAADTATAPPAAASLTREALVAEVLARNPEVSAAESAWRAALARVPQAAGLDDPMASYAIAPLSIGSSEVSFGQELRLSQRLPFPASDSYGARGPPPKRRRASSSSARRACGWRPWRRCCMTSSGCSIAGARSATSTCGCSPRSSRWRPAATLPAWRRSRRRCRPSSRGPASSRSWWRSARSEPRHRAPQRDAPSPAGRTLPPPPSQLAVADVDSEAGVDAAAADLVHPHLQAREAEVEARRSGLELARRAYLPDLELMTSYNSMWDMGEHRWMVGVGINLPVWRQRRKAAVAEAEAELAAGEAERAAFEDHIRQEIASARASVAETAALLRLHRDRVLPAARDQLAAARASFESGAADMLGVIEAERGLRSAQVDYYATVAAHASRRAELASALGRLAGSPQPLHPTHPSAPAPPARR